MKTILLKYLDSGDVVAHNVYEEFDTIEQAQAFALDHELKAYRIYSLVVGRGLL